MERKSILPSKEFLIGFVVLVAVLSLILSIVLSTISYNDHLRSLKNATDTELGNLIGAYRTRYYLAYSGHTTVDHHKEELGLGFAVEVVTIMNDTELLNDIKQFYDRYDKPIDLPMGPNIMGEYNRFINFGWHFMGNRMTLEEEMEFINRTYSELNKILKDVGIAITNYSQALSYNQIHYFERFIQRERDTVVEIEYYYHYYDIVVYEYNAAVNRFPSIAGFCGFNHIEPHHFPFPFSILVISFTHFTVI